MAKIEILAPEERPWKVREFIARLQAMPQEADVVVFLSPKPIDSDDAFPVNHTILTSDEPDLWAEKFPCQTVLLYV